MKRQCGTILTLTVCATMTACGDAFEPGDDSVGVATDALETNIINPNALDPSAHHSNALRPSMLAAGALSLSALSAEALAAIQMPGIDGDRSRQLLRYTVSCALAPTDSFSFTWTEEGVVHEESYPGLLGLSVNWRDKAPSSSDRRWVSACLAARANWYGIPVTISSRASHPALNKAGTPELTSHDMEEGAFWGDLFDDNPWLCACNYGPNRDHARSLLRDCAAGHLNEAQQVERCGMIQIVGDCQEHCDPLQPDGHYRPSCWSWLPWLSTSKVITVFLE